MNRPWLVLSPLKQVHSLRYALLFILALAGTSLIVMYDFQFNSASNPLQNSLRHLSTPPSADISFTPQASLDKSLDYRRMLELTTSPEHYNQHHPTLGFDHIYCISLPSRQDRRETMSKIATALGVKITFVDAISKNHSVIGWIGQRASAVRQRKLRLMAKHARLKKEDIGGMGPDSVWLTINHGKAANQISLKEIKLPSLSGPHSEFKGPDWVEYLWSVSDHSTLAADDPEFNVTSAMWDHQEKNPQRQINAATVSTYYNHLRVLRMIEKGGEGSALILEDDVDMEWDLERRWRSIQLHLPNDWETVFLGHCWGRELIQPQFGHPNLHKSTSPLCLHGYAVSTRGAKKLLKFYNDPWISFQTPVDTCIPTFIQLGLKSFSVEPTIINQSKIVRSDIQSGKGSKWKGLLVDSILERILKSEGQSLSQTSDYKLDDSVDPATLFRYKSLLSDKPTLAITSNCEKPN